MDRLVAFSEQRTGLLQPLPSFLTIRGVAWARASGAGRPVGSKVGPSGGDCRAPLPPQWYSDDDFASSHCGGCLLRPYGGVDAFAVVRAANANQKYTAQGDSP